MLRSVGQALQNLKDRPFVDSREYKVHVGGYDVEGISIAGQETSLSLPRCKVVFDIGRCPPRSVYQQTVLISHGHLDHVGGIAFHVCSRMMFDLSPSQIVVMPCYKDAVVKLLEAYVELCQGGPLEYEVKALEVGQELHLPSGYIARPFSTVHRIASQGYILYSQRKKLRKDLEGKTQQEIKELRLGGEEVTDLFEVPEVAFTGDTSGEFLEKGVNEDVFKAKLLIIEMTFVDDAVPVDQAREKGHMHVADFVAHAHRFENEEILLIHFSSRYSREHILQALDDNLPPALRKKCTPCLNGFT